jgi:alkylhydroperoxidase family enzyme
MSFIATVPPARATGETAEAYRYMARVAGHAMVAKIVQVFSLRPGSMRRFIRSWELSQWAGSEPRAMRELVAAAISRLNACHY